MASNSPGGYYGAKYSPDTTPNKAHPFQGHSHMFPGHPFQSPNHSFLPGDNGVRTQYGSYPGDPVVGAGGLYVRESGYYVSTSDGASTCSSNTTEASAEGEGGTLLVLEPKSLRSFTTNDEYLYAMKEDLADWFTCLYHKEVTAETFFTILETGVLLCQHANKVNDFARQRREKGEPLEMRSYFIRSVPDHTVPFREGVKPETFQARDNISNFISWSRQMGIPDVLSFETDDLVLRKNEKSVILCLLEIARVGAKLGMLAPTLVQMEEEIDAELAGEEPKPQVQIKTCDMRSLDERVRDLIGRCTCPIQFPMIKVGEGKYKIGDSRSLIFVRILRNHVMVRVGGGWDTLENYLNKHDPCQCNYRGHRAGTVQSSFTHKVSVNQQRRASAPGQNLTGRPVPGTPTSPRRANVHARSSSPQTRSKSPTLVISRHNPTPTKSVAHQNTSNNNSNNNNNNNISSHVTGRTTPTHHQEGAVSQSWSHSSQQNQPARCKSPSPGRFGSPSPSTATPSQQQASTPRPSVLRASSSSSLLKGKSAGSAGAGGSNFKSSAQRVRSSMLSGHEDADEADVEDDDEYEEEYNQRGLRSRIDEPRSIFQLDEELDGSVSFDERAEFEQDDVRSSLDSARDSTTSDATTNGGGGGGNKANVSMDKISTMTLSEFKSLLGSALTVPDHQTPASPGSDASGGYDQNKGLNWDSLREKAKSVRDSLSSSVNARKVGSGGTTSGSSTPGGRRSLPQSPMDDRARSVTDRPKTPLALRRSQNSSSASSVSRPKTPTSSVPRPKTPTSSVPRPKTPTSTGVPRPKTPTSSTTGYRPKTPSSLDRENSGAPREEYRLSRPKTPSQIKRDAVAKVAGAISNWVESRHEMDNAGSVPNRPKTPTRPKTPVSSRSYPSQRGNDEYDNDDEEDENDEIAGALANPVVHSMSTAKERPSTPSRIPKPCFTPRPETPKSESSTTSGSIPRPQSATPACQARGRVAASSRPTVISRSSSNSSNVRSPPDATLPSPASCHSEDLTYRTSSSVSRPATVISRKQPQSSASSTASNGSSSSKTYTDIHSRRPANPGAPRSQPSRSVTPGPREKWSINHEKHGEASIVTTQNAAPRRRASVTSTLPTEESKPGTDSNGAPMRRTSSSGDLLDSPQMLLTNEITFSDDEEINELVKNAALKQSQAAANNKVRSASVDARKLARQHSREQKDSEVLMVRRDSSGHHGVQVYSSSNQIKYDSTSKSQVVKRPSSRGSSTDRGPASTSNRARSQTPDPAMQRRAALTKQKEVRSGDKSVNRTEAWVDSTLSDPKRKPPPRPKRATSFGHEIPPSELASRPLEEIQAILPEPKNGIVCVDVDNLDAPPEDPEMYKKMEKLFEKYREMELRASVNATPGGGDVPNKTDAPPTKSVNQKSSSRSSPSVASAKTSSGSLVSSSGMSSNVSSSGRGGTGNHSVGSDVNAKPPVGSTSAGTAASDRFRRSTSVPNSFQIEQKQSQRNRVSNSNNTSNVSSPSQESKTFVTDQSSRSRKSSGGSSQGVSSLKDIDTEIAKNPAALMSKIKEILRVRPRKDENSQIPTRIPAPASLSKAGRSKSVSNLYTREGLSNELSLKSEDDSANSEGLSSGRGQRPPLHKANSTSSGNIAYAEFVYTDDVADEVPDLTRTWSVQSDSSDSTNRCETPVPKLPSALTTGRSTFINRRGDRLSRGLSQDKENNLSNSQSSLSSRSVLSATEDDADFV